jgi:hypothetical protein
MVLLDEKGLEGAGVNALGARRKLLKSVSPFLPLSLVLMGVGTGYSRG